MVNLLAVCLNEVCNLAISDEPDKHEQCYIILQWLYFTKYFSFTLLAKVLNFIQYDIYVFDLFCIIQSFDVLICHMLGRCHNKKRVRIYWKFDEVGINIFCSWNVWVNIGNFDSLIFMNLICWIGDEFVVDETAMG